MTAATSCRASSRRRFPTWRCPWDRRAADDPRSQSMSARASSSERCFAGGRRHRVCDCCDRIKCGEKRRGLQRCALRDREHKGRWHDADDCMGLIVQARSGRPLSRSPPERTEPAGDHHDDFAARRSSSAVKPRPASGRTPSVRKTSEVTRRYPAVSDRLDRTDSRRAEEKLSAHRVEARAHVTPVDEVRRRSRVRGMPSSAGLVQRHQPLRHCNGSGRSNTWSSSVKAAVVAPMPSAITRTAVSANPGDRRSMRKPYRTS